MNEIRLTGKLVGAQELLNELFSDGCRPSMRWLLPRQLFSLAQAMPPD